MSAIKPRFFATPAAFRRWLEAHHESARELWVGFHKRGSGQPSLTWPESVDEALCFGWIDGLRKSLDETSYVIRFTPRRTTSNWSAVNRKRMPQLIAERRVRPAGLKAFERRKERESELYSYEQPRSELVTAALGEPLERRFRGHQAAWEYFQALPPWYRRAVTRWVVSAKREETRQKRLSVLIDCSSRRQPIPGLEGRVKARMLIGERPASCGPADPARGDPSRRESE